MRGCSGYCWIADANKQCRCGRRRSWDRGLPPQTWRSHLLNLHSGYLLYLFDCVETHFTAADKSHWSTCMTGLNILCNYIVITPRGDFVDCTYHNWFVFLMVLPLILNANGVRIILSRILKFTKQKRCLGRMCYAKAHKMEYMM